DLSNAGRLTVAALHQKIVDPNTPLPPAPGAAGGGRGFPGGGGGRGGGGAATVVVKMPDGKEIRGVRRNEDSFSLQMVDATGQLQLIDKTKVASVTVDTKSLMPADYAVRLTAADINNVVAFLHAQAGRDPAKTAAQPVAGGV